MDVPKSINDLTLNNYRRFKTAEKANYRIDESDPLSHLQKHNKLLSVVTGHSLDYIENEVSALDLQDKYYPAINSLIESKEAAKVKTTIKVNGKAYNAIKSERDLNTNQYIALKEWEKDLLNNAHLIASLFYYPGDKWDSKKQPDIAQEFLEHGKVGDVFGTLFFYLRKLEKLNKTSHLSLIQEMEAVLIVEGRMREIKEELQALGLSTDGSISSMRSHVEAMLKEKSY